MNRFELVLPSGKVQIKEHPVFARFRAIESFWELRPRRPCRAGRRSESRSEHFGTGLDRDQHVRRARAVHIDHHATNGHLMTHDFPLAPYAHDCAPARMRILISLSVTSRASSGAATSTASVTV